MKKSNGLFFMAFIVFMSVHVLRMSPERPRPRLRFRSRLAADRESTSASCRGAIGTPSSSRASPDRNCSRSERSGWNDEAWQALASCVGDRHTTRRAVLGRYTVTAEAVQFEPRFPFDPGRSYSVRFDPARLPTPRSRQVSSSRPSRFPRARSARRPS